MAGRADRAYLPTDTFPCAARLEVIVDRAPYRADRASTPVVERFVRAHEPVQSFLVGLAECPTVVEVADFVYARRVRLLAP